MATSSFSPSSDFPQSSGSSTAAAPTMTSNDDDDDSGGPGRGASYFFGFLIAFIGLLIIFIGCGVCTRRRFRRRRTQNILDFGVLPPWADNGSALFYPRGLMQEEPKFWEVYMPEDARKGAAESAWQDAQPLCGTYGPASEGESGSKAFGKSSSESQRPPLGHMDSPNPHAINGLSLPSWLPSRSNAEKPPDGDEPESDSIQVAVMIAMPEQPRNRQRAEGELGEYQIGVAHVPWGRDG